MDMPVCMAQAPWVGQQERRNYQYRKPDQWVQSESFGGYRFLTREFHGHSLCVEVMMGGELIFMICDHQCIRVRYDADVEGAERALECYAVNLKPSGS